MASYLGVYNVSLGSRPYNLELSFSLNKLRRLDKKLWSEFGLSAMAILGKGAPPVDFTIWALVIGCAEDYKKQHSKTLTDKIVTDAISQMDGDARADVSIAVMKVIFVASGKTPSEVDAIFADAEEEEEAGDPLEGGGDEPQAETGPPIPDGQ